ncbi:chorismate synthase [Lentinula raphanica]|nr:chorismate synthase [Lentinula raphanica]
MSTFGHLFRVTTFGESHCASVGAIIDGCPPGLTLSPEDIQIQLDRRRPGQSDLTTPVRKHTLHPSPIQSLIHIVSSFQRNEKDRVHLQSGLELGVTLGTPIALLVKNEDQRPHDYSETDLYPRPSHADYTYLEKYGVKASSGGGRSSARETIGRVAAGAIAEKYLKTAFGIEVVAFVSSVGKINIPFSVPSSSPSNEDEDDVEDALSEEFRNLLATVTRDQVDRHATRCPHPETAERMTQRIIRAKDASDSIGGTVTCVIRNVPSGLGEPCFDKFEATLAHAMLSIPATKAFEIGSGFRGTQVPGSKHNDAFVRTETGNGKLRTKTNWSGGVQGGITNGEDIYFRIGFKSPATISQAQSTAQYDGTLGSLAARGRHDPCVVPRAVPIVEAMASLVVMDQLLIQNARKTAASLLPPITTLPPTMVIPGAGAGTLK